jgi:hypothetical protein
MRLSASWLLVLTAGCGSSDPGSIFSVTTGHEDDTFTADPEVTRIEVTRTDEDGNETTLAQLTTPPTSIDLSKTGAYQYSVLGSDQDGELRAVGRSFWADAKELSGQKIPLFVSRTDRFCRPPEGLLVDQGTHPLAVIYGGSIIWTLGGRTTDGDSVWGDGYSVAYWQQTCPPSSFRVTDCPSPPCHYRSLAVVGRQHGVVLGEDYALGIDGVSGIESDYALPDGLESWGYVAGGRTFGLPDDTAYIVGGTRTGQATVAVVFIDDGASLSHLSLTVARSGAAAVYVEGHGLVVVGGSPEGTGVEVLATGDDTFTALAYPSDPVTGAGLLIEDESHLLRVGGRTAEGDPAPTVHIDLGCDGECELQPEPDFDLDALDVQGFSGEIQDVVVGYDADDLTLAWRRTNSGFEPLELREQRQGATALALPTGNVALIGGLSSDEGNPLSTLELVAY